MQFGLQEEKKSNLYSVEQSFKRPSPHHILEKYVFCIININFLTLCTRVSNISYNAHVLMNNRKVMLCCT